MSVWTTLALTPIGYGSFLSATVPRNTNYLFVQTKLKQMVKFSKIKRVVAKSGSNKGKEINVLFFVGKVPGTKTTRKNVLLAFGLSAVEADNESKDNTATLVLSDAGVQALMVNAGMDKDAKIELLEGMEFPVDIRMDFNDNTEKNRGVVIDTAEVPFKIATTLVEEGKGGLYDNRTSVTTPKTTEEHSEADLTAKKAAVEKV